MLRHIFHSVQGRIIGVLILFMSLSFVASLYTINTISLSSLMAEKGNKLLSVAAYLDERLGERTYDDILRVVGASSAPREAQIAALNAALTVRTDEISSIFPGLGVGYYSLDLDAIVTYGPSSQYQSSVGLPIADDHPGRIVMQTNTPMIRNGTMVRGNIMNAMQPIERQGRVIGYAWANELTTQIEQEYRLMSGRVAIFMSAFFFVSITAAIFLSRRLIRDVGRVVSGVKDMRYDLSRRITGVGGEMEVVAGSINAMAEHIEKTAREHEALIVAEAANLAQRDFLARMSHEIRTPMNGVLGMTRLAMQAESRSESQAYLEKIQSSASLLLGIINDILDFSKIEAGKLELESTPFSLRQTAANLCELLLPRTQEKGLTLELAIDDSVPEIAVGDGLKLSQVLLNLLGNAVKFTAEGSVTLAMRAAMTPEQIVLYATVTDTGIGMTEEQTESLFRPFSQADNSTVRRFGGTGLGLFISKALIELMNGEISFSSRAGYGSEFRFFVVLKQPDEGDLTCMDAPEACETERFDGLKVLLVEDNDINREIALAILGEFGMTVDSAENGEAAVEAFLRARYDVIFMDIRMPVMDGLEATRRIRNFEAARGEACPVPIIAMTANAMREDRIASREAGMNGHIAKPLDLQEIRRVLGDVLGGPQAPGEPTGTALDGIHS